MRRVVVTGMGMVSPLGSNVNTTWDNLIAGKSGITKVDRFDVSDITSKIAGLVPNSFNADDYVPLKEQKKIDLFITYGIAAAIQAIEDSGWMPTDEESLTKTGVLIGSGIGGLIAIETNTLFVEKNGTRRLSPFFIPASLINLVSGHVSIKYGFCGPNLSVVTACSTGAHAIGDAARIIKDGDADVMVAGSTEAAVCHIGMAGFAALRALSTNFNDNPEQGSRPWDKDRDGFVMGEGAGVVVLEEYEHAKKRGAKIYAEVVGYGLSGDGYHITAPHPEGRGAELSVRMALRKSGLNLDEIDYVNAHGTSTPLGDEIELGVVQRVFGEHSKNLSMSSTKSAIGHLLGAAGSLEAIIAIEAMRNGIIPPTLNLENPIDEAIDFNLAPLKAQEKAMQHILSNSFGFGGTNISLIFGKI
jgi:3-oxoacyl-[acyl-carrier-protein] synthase II